MWNRQILILPKDKDININPNCLKVESATTFLESDSKRAANLAINNVTIPREDQIKGLHELITPNRIVNQTPAVTNVDLCTKALTGVGAAIAAGSHLMKGH